MYTLVREAGRREGYRTLRDDGYRTLFRGEAEPDFFFFLPFLGEGIGRWGFCVFVRRGTRKKKLMVSGSHPLLRGARLGEREGKAAAREGCTARC